MGSIIESDYMKQQFGMIGLNENQIAQIGGDKTVYDCVAGTELITETEVNSDSNIYISWVSSALQGDMQAVGTATITCYSWFPGTKPTIAQKLGTISISPNSQTVQDSIQDPVQQLSTQADYLYIIGDFEIMQIYSMYYLIPDEGVTKYDCYQTDGNYISSIPYGNAKTIIDNTMVSDGFNLPSGEREMIVWNSPYGLCAYSRTYKDYYPWSSVDENGNSIENYPDVSQMPYELNEDDIRQELEILGLPENIVIPTSNKTE